MRNAIWLNNGTAKLIVLFGFLLLFSTRCAGTREPSESASIYNFEFQGENYRIRSLSAVNSVHSCNELIGKKFVAKDYDKDGIIDEIVLGESTFPEAQSIYQYALTQLNAQHKLRQINPEINVFQLENSKYNYEIKSFRQVNSGPFNEFRVYNSTKISETNISISIDRKADGNLDEVVTGALSLKDLQQLYTKALDEGLKKNQIIETDNEFIVK